MPFSLPCSNPDAPQLRVEKTPLFTILSDVLLDLETYNTIRINDGLNFGRLPSDRLC